MPVRVLIVALSLILTAGALEPTVAQQSAPPASQAVQDTPNYSSLIGRYRGPGSALDGRTSDERLQIKEVTGDKFKGTIYIGMSFIQPYLNRDVAVTGEISGKPGEEKLIFNIPGIPVPEVLSRKGNKLEGKRGSFDILLTKE